MRYSDLMERLERAAPFPDEEAAEAALEATLGTLGEALPAQLARDLAAVLPRELSPCLDVEPSAGTLDADAFDARVARRAGLSFRDATEQAQVVCAVLASAIDGELRTRIERSLEAPLAQRFVPREVVMQPLHSAHGEHTLAAGRPGGTHPLSESAPFARHPLSASRPRGPQRGSVASEPNPHADQKLSSARGLTQEREHETLAEGKPPR